MRICVDVQSAITQRSGVGRYTRELVEHLGPLAGEHQLRLFYFDFKRRGERWQVPNAQMQAVRWLPGRVVQKAWQYAHFPPFDWLAGKADLYHFPNFVCPPLSRGKSVVTIHDVSFLRYPDFTEEKNRRYLKAQIARTVARADRIITDSRFSGQEIAELLQVPAERISPIHLGISPDFRPAGGTFDRFLMTRSPAQTGKSGLSAPARRSSRSPGRRRCTARRDPGSSIKGGGFPETGPALCFSCSIDLASEKQPLGPMPLSNDTVSARACPRQVKTP